MPRQYIHTSINTITDTKTLTTTEDTYLVHDNGDEITLMIADGAPQRLKTTGSLQPLYRQYEHVSKPGQYAASLIRDITAEYINTQPKIPVSDIPLVANQRLKEMLESIYGEVSATAVLQKEPTLTRLQDDPRLVRLILPACCFTIARLDLKRGILTYVHGGDTALFLLYQDGRTVQITPDQMKQHDDKVRQERYRIVQEYHPKDEKEYTSLTAHAQVINVNNGIYHNYEDESGDLDLAVGVGVINGLPQLEAYMVEDTISIDGIEGIVLTSDGMFWPAPLDESDHEAEERVNHMGDLIRQHGVKGYLQVLRTEYQDLQSKDYNRFGKLDDATAVQVRIERK